MLMPDHELQPGTLMTSSELISLAPTILVPIVTAVVGGVGLQLQDWQRRRSRAVRRRAAIEDAGKQVTFVAQWWDATAAVVASPEDLAELRGRARRWLEEAARLALESESARVDEPRGGTARRLLLLVPLSQTAARRLRVVYFIFLGAWVIVLGAATRDTLTLDRDYITGDLVAAIILGAVSMLLRFWTVSIEDSARPGAAPKIRPEQSLLLYPLHGWWPRIVRVLFYGLVICSAIFVVYAIKVALRSPTAIPLLLAQAGVLTGYCVGLCAWVISAVPPDANSGPGRAGTWLLLYPFRTGRGIATRAAFYVVLLLVAFTIAGVVSDMLGAAGSDTIATGLDILITLVLAAAVMRRLAVVSESAVTGPVARTPLDRILLIYKLESRTAKITRGLFYIAVLILVGHSIDIVTSLLDPAMPEVNPDLPDTGIALLASAALWASTILLNRRRIMALSSGPS
jgi:hypothetical protein